MLVGAAPHQCPHCWQRKLLLEWVEALAAGGSGAGWTEQVSARVHLPVQVFLTLLAACLGRGHSKIIGHFVFSSIGALAIGSALSCSSKDRFCLPSQSPWSSQLVQALRHSFPPPRHSSWFCNVTVEANTVNPANVSTNGGLMLSSELRKLAPE